MTSINSQTTNTLLMVAPEDFTFNEQTAADNEFQQRVTLSPDEVQRAVREEFAGAVATLRGAGIKVIVLEGHERTEPLPDAVFPNNWIATAPGGGAGSPMRAMIFPMATPNRRAEAGQWPAVAAALEAAGHPIPTPDYLTDEFTDVFLEGTGSLILDRVNGVVYASRSVRTAEPLVHEFARRWGYDRVVMFTARSRAGRDFYHTNVVMSVGTSVAVVCLEAVPEASERLALLEALTAHHEVIPVTLDQTAGAFAANILEVRGHDDLPHMVMSQTAYDSLRAGQRERLARHARPLPIRIPTIERIGGGSARCMLAELFV